MGGSGLKWLKTSNPLICVSAFLFALSSGCGRSTTRDTSSGNDTGGTSGMVGQGGMGASSGRVETGGIATSGDPSGSGGSAASGGNVGSAGASGVGGISQDAGLRGDSGAIGTAGAAGRTGTSDAGAIGFKFMLGADISSVDEAVDWGTQYVDTDGATKPILDILKNHGFNFIRLRTFVKPGAKYGYAYGTGGSCIKQEPYCDKDHTIAVARQVKAAGMGFLLDLHYSDTWADPNKQVIPEDWRSSVSVAELAAHVKDHTTDVVSSLVSAGARPDMVQIGNETTAGMLTHVPNADTDCWGNNASINAINGSVSNWTNLGQLLKAGVAGVKAVDPSIKIMVHIENTKNASAAASWVRNALDQGVAIDVVGLSCYTFYQGEPSVWQNTFATLAASFPDLSFVIAEYNPQRTQANKIMHDLPNGKGLGTFFWEPTQGGDWGSPMFTYSGKTAQANKADFEEFDTIRTTYGL